MQAFITQPVQLKAAKQYVAHGEYSKSGGDYWQYLNIEPHSDDVGANDSGYHMTLTVSNGGGIFLNFGGVLRTTKNQNKYTVKDSENGVKFTIKVLSNKKVKITAKGLNSDGKWSVKYLGINGKYKLDTRHDYTYAS